MPSDLPKEEFIEIPPEISSFRIFTSGKGKVIDKLHFANGLTQKHYTIHFGFNSGEIDLHSKNERTGKHKTIIKVPHYTLARMFVMYSKFNKHAVKKYLLKKKINYGKLDKYHCVLMKMGGETKNAEEFVELVNRKGAPHKIRLKSRIRRSAFDGMYIDPYEVYDDETQTFQLFRVKNGIWKSQGYIFKHYDGTKRQFFLVDKSAWDHYMAMNYWGIVSTLHCYKYAKKDFILRLIRKSNAEIFNSSPAYRKTAEVLGITKSPNSAKKKTQKNN